MLTRQDPKHFPELAEMTGDYRPPRKPTDGSDQLHALRRWKAAFR